MRPAVGPITIPAILTVKELSDLLNVTPVEVIKRLMVHGVMASMNQTVDYEMAARVAEELGAEPSPAETTSADSTRQIRAEITESDIDKMQPRPPVIAILGHVDHGKTSLLDAIRETNVTAGEAGGITQHIGAYQIEWNGNPLTFIDTPGHEAFTSMRARGARVTDIAVLVVAADDGVMPQTIEAINHIQAAGVPMIVAINKVDLPGANPDRVKQQLTEHSVVVEDFGGDVVTAEVSAKTRQGLDGLLESIVLVAEISELQANPDRPAAGVIVEAKLDTSRGAMATLLVQEGTLRVGDAFVVGEVWGKAKAMFDALGQPMQEAGPSVPAEVMGLNEVPAAGDLFEVVENEKEARRIVEQRQRSRVAREGEARTGLEAFATEVSAGTAKELTIVLKTDVKGTAEALKRSLEELATDEVQVRVLGSGQGPVTDSDVMLAEASSGIIVAFNVKTEPGAERRAEAAGVEIRTYDIIYTAIEDVEAAINGMLEPIYREVDTGRAEVRQTFRSSRLGTILGCYVLEGTISRNARVRLIRNGEVIAKARMQSLKRFQEDVREVQAGFECGIVLDINEGQEGDIIQCYVEERVR